MRETWDVAVDLDGVLYDFVEVFASEVRGCGLPHARVPSTPRPNRWDFFRSWGLSDEEFSEVFSGGVRAGRIFWEGEVYPGVHEGWRSLREQGHRLHIVTDRSPVGAEREAKAATVSWLSRQGFDDASLTVTSDKGSALLDLARDRSRTVFIDDKPENIQQSRSVGVMCVLMDQPWNADFAYPRVRSFSQFAALVGDESSGNRVLPDSARPGFRVSGVGGVGL